MDTEQWRESAIHKKRVRFFFPDHIAFLGKRSEAAFQWSSIEGYCTINHQISPLMMGLWHENRKASLVGSTQLSPWPYSRRRTLSSVAEYLPYEPFDLRCFKHLYVLRTALIVEGYLLVRYWSVNKDSKKCLIKWEKRLINVTIDLQRQINTIKTAISFCKITITDFVSTRRWAS